MVTASSFQLHPAVAFQPLCEDLTMQLAELLIQDNLQHVQASYKYLLSCRKEGHRERARVGKTGLMLDSKNAYRVTVALCQLQALWNVSGPQCIDQTPPPYVRGVASETNLQVCNS